MNRWFKVVSIHLIWKMYPKIVPTGSVYWTATNLETTPCLGSHQNSQVANRLNVIYISTHNSDLQNDLFASLKRDHWSAGIPDPARESWPTTGFQGLYCTMIIWDHCKQLSDASWIGATCGVRESHEADPDQSVITGGCANLIWCHSGDPWYPV